MWWSQGSDLKTFIFEFNDSLKGWFPSWWSSWESHLHNNSKYWFGLHISGEPDDMARKLSRILITLSGRSTLSLEVHHMAQRSRLLVACLGEARRRNLIERIEVQLCSILCGKWLKFIYDYFCCKKINCFDISLLLACPLFIFIDLSWSYCCGLSFSKVTVSLNSLITSFKLGWSWRMIIDA